MFLPSAFPGRTATGLLFPPGSMESAFLPWPGPSRKPGMSPGAGLSCSWTGLFLVHRPPSGAAALPWGRHAHRYRRRRHIRLKRREPTHALPWGGINPSIPRLPIAWAVDRWPGGLGIQPGEIVFQDPDDLAKGHDHQREAALRRAARRGWVDPLRPAENSRRGGWAISAGGAPIGGRFRSTLRRLGPAPRRGSVGSSRCPFRITSRVGGQNSRGSQDERTVRALGSNGRSG